MSLTHQYFQNRIQSGQRLTSEEQAAVDQHLAFCPECSAFSAFHRQLGEMLPNVYPHKRRGEGELRSRMEAVKDRLAKRRWQTLIFRGSLSLTGAVAVVLLLVILVSLPRMMPEPSPAAPQATGASISIIIPATPEPSSQPEEPATATATATLKVAQTAVSSFATQTPSLLPTNPPVAEPPGVVHGVAMSGQTAFTGTGNRVTAIDISQPSDPKIVALSPELPGMIGKILPVNSLKVPRIVAAAGRYLVVLENAAPGDLGLVTQSKLPGTIHAMILDISASRLYTGGSMNGDPSKGFITVHDSTPGETLELLDTLQLDAPVRSLALSRGYLYAAAGGSNTGIMVASLVNDRLNEPLEAIPAIPAYSLSSTGGVLYAGTADRMLAYDLSDPYQPQLSWQADMAGEASIPGPVLGFVLRADAIHLAGVNGDGLPYRLVITPPEPVTAGTVVDTASIISIARGLMLVGGERMEIYDVRDPQNVTRLADFRVQP